ncbi:Type I Iterative PKS [Paecilomyces lecythidis]
MHIFGINNLEAMYMDAQQRKLLEVVYESFESAGVPLERVQKSQTGVYIGNFTNDFMVMQYRDPEYFTRFSATGSGLTVMANRISHCFDLRGPSMVLDTACSSSLYALHCACLGLDARDCDAAVVASANLIQTPEGQLVATKAGILSPDSFCHTFDETANGYGRAEGVSAVYLKRLGDAIRDGDPIRAVIRGTAINGNGKTPGIVQPSADGQEAVIRAAYDRAGLPTDGTDCVEAHGTGTRVGDPIEVEAISRVFCHQTGRPTLVGGVKPNLGHSEGASGLVSLIKVALALEKGIIPATLGVRNINPSIKTADWNVKIVTANIEWPASSIPRASINSFGFGGANSHAILEAAPRQYRGYTNPGSNGNSRGICHTKGHMNKQAHTTGSSPSNDDGERLYLIPLSARSAASLTQQVTNLATCIAQPKHRIAVQDLSYTLSCHRSKLSTRGFVLASQSTLTSNMDVEKFAIHQIDGSGNLPLTFIYTGQGAQWTKMGVELLQYSSIFLHSIRGLDFCLQTLSSRRSPNWTIEGVLRDLSGKNDINLADKSQTVCTAIQIAITDVLHDLGIHPKTVIGHSSGEMAAAYAAGIITPRQAITAAYFRGTVVSCSLEKGGMACVGLGKLPAQRLIDEFSCHESIVIACINSPENTTLSGDETAVDVLLQALKRRGIWSKRLDTGGTAYHSHHMKKIGKVYQAWLKEEWSNTEAVTNGRMARHMDDYVNGHAKGYKKGVRMISTISGNNERPEKVASPAYWRSNLESPVLFENAVRQIMKTGRSHFVEIGPHSTLKLPITQTSAVVDGDGLLCNSALIRSRNAWMTILDLVGSLYLRGRDEIRLEKISFHDDIPSPKILVDLPPYPWDYSSPAL